MVETTPVHVASSGSIRTLIELVPQSVFVHDVRGRFVDANRHACESLGYSHGELLTMSVYDIELEHRLVVGSLWEQMEPGSLETVQGMHRRADGTTFPVEIRLSVLEAEGRKLFLALAQPVERERQGIEELIASRDLERNAFRKIFENANEALAIIDHAGRYLLQNDAHARLLGYDDHELVDKTPAIHLGPAVFGEIASELATKGTYHGEHVSRSKQGVSQRIELSAFAVPQSEGRPPIFVGIKRNLGELDRARRERADRERSALEETLRQAQKMELIGQLAAGVGHDFNNLLTPILGYSDPAFGPDDDLHGTRERLQQIHDAAQRGRELTARLLAFGRKQVLEVKPIDLGELVTRFAAMLRRVIREEIEIDVQVDPALRAVPADETAIGQILMNLATNASDAMPSGGRMLIAVRNLEAFDDDPLALALGRTGSFVRLTFTDTGKGMDEETLSHVFEPFYTRKDRGEGTGLGLSIVYGIVRQHDGFISARSTPGAGATFEIVLPPTDARPEPVARRESDPARATGETILVAEDEPQVRALVARVLEEQGYRVLIAEDGREAMELAAGEERPIDLLLTDVVMPRANGRELFDELRSRHEDLRVLFMSGYSRDVLIPGGKLSPDVALVQKPFTPAELGARVRQVLGSPVRG